MSESTRRGFLAVAGAGAAAGVVAVAAPAAGAAAPAKAPAAAPALPASANGSMAAYIRDVRRGELVVMTGEHEVVVTDHELVARLAHAFDQASRRG